MWIKTSAFLGSAQYVRQINMIYSINLDIIFTLIQRINSITDIFFGIWNTTSHYPNTCISHSSRQNHIFNPICVRAYTCINARQRRTSTPNSRWNDSNQMIVENHGSPRISPACVDSTDLFARTHLCRIDFSALLHLFKWCLTFTIVPHLNIGFLKRISSITCSKMLNAIFIQWRTKKKPKILVPIFHLPISSSSFTLPHPAIVADALSYVVFPFSLLLAMHIGWTNELNSMGWLIWSNASQAINRNTYENKKCQN